MSNTELLKNEIQEYFKKSYLQNSENVSVISDEDKSNFEKIILAGIKPDFYELINNTLVIGEITVSGFLHEKSHIGISKKVTEAFSKFSIIQHRFRMNKNQFSFDSIRCLFIIPFVGKSSFDHIGWRNDLFSMSVMSLKKIDISQNQELIDKIKINLGKSTSEQKKI